MKIVGEETSKPDCVAGGRENEGERNAGERARGEDSEGVGVEGHCGGR